MKHPYDILSKLMDKFDDAEGVTYVTSAMHEEIAHEINDLMAYGYIKLNDAKSMAHRAAFEMTKKGLEAYDMPSAFFTDMDKSEVWSKSLEQAEQSVEELREKAREGGLWATPMEWNLPKFPVSETVRENVVANLPVPEKSWLQNALEITTSDRRRDYGHPLPNFLRICLKWSVTLQIPVTPLHVAQLMLDMKTARDQNSFKDDNWVDAIGYSNTVQMIDERMKEMGYPAGAKTFQDRNVTNMVGFMYNLLQTHELRYPQGT